MTPRNVIIVIAGMCLSLSAVFIVVGLVVTPESFFGPRRKAPHRAPRWMPSPGHEPGTSRSARPAPATPPGAGEAATAEAEAPDAGAEIGSRSSVATPLTQTAPKDSTVAAASALASRHLALLSRDLKAQVTALRKSRDSMMDDLAGELAEMSPERAAEELRPLDDESAGLVLARLSPRQRKALLNSLDPRRAKLLDRKARTWAAK